MHYYKRDIGKYAKKAGKLSMLQHGACTMLIDACHDREQFPTLEEAIDWAWASSPEEVEAVTFVLKKIFTFEDGVYVHDEIKENLARYHRNAATNQRIAIERETKRREEEAKREQDDTNRAQSDNEPPPNKELRIKNYKLLTNALAGARAGQPALKTSVDKFFAENDYLSVLQRLRPELEGQADWMKSKFTIFHREKKSRRSDWPAQWERWVLCEREGE